MHNAVDFYFRYIGHPLPKQFKSIFLTEKVDTHNELTTQLYIIFARISLHLFNLLVRVFDLHRYNEIIWKQNNRRPIYCRSKQVLIFFHHDD